MKKLAFLAVILVAASVASAGFKLDISETSVMPGDIVTVTVIQEAPNAAGASGGEMTLALAGNVVSTTDLTAGFAEGGTWLWSSNFGISQIPGGVWFAKVPMLGMPTPGVGSLSATGEAYTGTVAFTFTATETTDIVWGGTWDGVDMGGVVGGTVNVVPEPMTMALLGLGGLFLRRRK